MHLNPALRKATELGIGLTAIATLILAGCGGGSSSASGGGGNATTTLSISPSLGRFAQGANVRIKDRNGAQIASGYTDASGVASINVPTSAQTPLLVEAGLSGDQYFDEKQGIFVPVSGVNGAAVRALVPDHTVASQVAVTALTEIAVGSLLNTSGVIPAGVTAASAVGANATVAQSFGVTDLLIPPKLVGSKTEINGLGATEADKYALTLAALANMAGTGEDALKVAHRLRQDLNNANPTAASGIANTITLMKTAMANMPSAPAGATTIANAIVVPHANAKLVDLIPAAMNAANTQLAALDPALTKAQIIAAINTAALNNASGVMAAIAANPTQSIASAIQNAQTLAQQQSALSTPAVSSFSPTSGVAGDTITITGTGFDPFYQHNTVKFNGMQATVTAGSTTSLTVTVPAGAATGRITVTNTMSQLLNKTGTSATSFTVNTATGGGTTTPAVPTITGFSPASGVIGTTITITGTNFGAAPASSGVKYDVKFNGVQASILGVGTTTMTVTVPSGVTTGPITITTTTGTVTSATSFTVNTATSGGATTPVIAAGTKLGGAIQGTTLSLSAAVSTIAGTAGSMGTVDAVGTAATFFSPQSITSDGSSLYVGDGSKIRKIDIATGQVSTLTGTSAFATTIAGITTDGANLYVSDAGNYTIWKYNLASGVASLVAGNRIAAGGSVDAIGAAARFNAPQAITTDGVNLYVADKLNYTIRKIVIATGEVTTLAGTAGTYGSTNATGPAASFSSFVGGLTTDGINLYVADTNNQMIRQVVIASGQVTTLAGMGLFAPPLTAAPSDGVGTQARLRTIGGLTSDGTYLYFTEQSHNTIRKLALATGQVTTFAGSGTAGNVDGTGTAAQFKGPGGIVCNGTSLFVLDNNTVRRIQ